MRLCTSAVATRMFLRTTGDKQRLRHCECLKQRKATTADIESVAVFPQAQFGVKKCGKRRIGVVRFAGRQDPVQTVRFLTGFFQQLFARLRAQCAFVLIFGNVSHGHDAGAAFQFSRGHTEGVVHFLGRDNPRAKGTGRTNDVNIGDSQSWDLVRFQVSKAEKEQLV